MVSFKKFFMLLCLLSISYLFGMTKDSEFALFKRSVSPVYEWGENGIMTVQKATTIGKNNFYMGINTLDAGKLQGDRLFLTSATVMFSSSEDVEIGYTKRVFVWDDLDYANLKMDTFHLKGRFFNMTENLIPQIAVGVNAVSLKDESYNKRDMLYDIYLVATSQFNYFENFKLSVTASAERLYDEHQTSDVMFSGGVDMIVLKHLYLLAEIQGINKNGDNGIINVGAKLKLGWFSIGGGIFNLTREEFSKGDLNDEKNYWIANMTLEIPFGKIFSKR